MDVRTCVLLTILATATYPGLARAGDKPDAQEILRKADAATKAVKVFSYEAESVGTGDLAKRLPHVRGTLLAQQGRRGFLSQILGIHSGKEKMRLRGTTTPPKSETEKAFLVATNGREFFSGDDKQKRYIRGGRKARRLLDPADQLFMIEYLHPTPFSDEIHARIARYEGEKEVGGVNCDVIYVVYRQTSPDSRWYFGQEDSLPRRVERIYKTGAVTGSRILTISNLEVDPEFTAKDFTLDCPKGYETKEYENPANRPLLAVGAKAPDWKLKTPDGQTVSLKSLRGNVVVMDFWATWCGPCKKAMPGMQKLHEEFKSRRVKVLGINCWDPRDAAAYMKSQKYTYPLLLHGDQAAEDYQLSGIPTFYVIDPEGRVAYAASGFLPHRDKELRRIIEKSLAQSGG